MIKTLVYNPVLGVGKSYTARLITSGIEPINTGSFMLRSRMMLNLLLSLPIRTRLEVLNNAVSSEFTEDTDEDIRDRILHNLGFDNLIPEFRPNRHTGLNPSAIIIDDPYMRMIDTVILDEKSVFNGDFKPNTNYVGKDYLSKVMIARPSQEFIPQEQKLEASSPKGMKQTPNPNKKLFTSADRRVRTKKKKQAKKQRMR